MADLQDIKHRLLDEGKVEFLFEALECGHIATRHRRVEASLPDSFGSSNKRSVQCKLTDSLSCSIRNRTDFKGGDIYSLVSYLRHGKRGDELQADLPNAKAFICETMGWDEYLSGGAYVSKVDYVAPLKALLKDRKNRREIRPNPTLPETVLESYFPYPSHDWLVEGISFRTQKRYGIGFDLDSKRITIPMRNRFGQLIGVKGRILKPEDDDRKYLYLHPFNNGQELFNFHIALPAILTAKRVYIFEGEKSCLKMHDAGVDNAVAIGSSDLTDVQADLLKQCGLDVDIVLCFDSDKSPADIREIAKVFGDRTIFALVDTRGRLGEKMSPIDRGIDIFRQLEKEDCYPIK